jgi:hypothetical protein
MPVIPIRKALRFTESGSPGLIPGSSPGTAVTWVKMALKMFTKGW